MTDARPDRPNILVFMTDDHGQWAANCYGASEISTPNMDRLAATGVRMTRAFTPSPVCSPARASFFTGCLPSQHGIHDWLDETNNDDHAGLSGQTHISQLLQAAGYETALIGKWHCGDSRTPKPGFDRWFSYDDSQYPHLGEQRFSDEGKRVVEHGYQSPFLTDRAIDWLRRRDTDRPFFLFVGYVNTHSPWQDQPERLVAPYRNASFADVPTESFDSWRGDTVLPVPEEPEAHREQQAQYYAAATMIDEQIGRVLDQLEGTNQLDNTLIVYTADHGLMCGQHGTYGKGNATTPQNFLEESILVPCLLSWPAVLPQGSVCDALVDHCDLFCTVIDAATDDLEETIRKMNSPGRSYLPILTSPKRGPIKDRQYCEYGNARMIRSDRYKLIVRYPSCGIEYENEFFDLLDDPRERTNRIDDASLRPIVKELSDQLDQHFAQYETSESSGRLIDDQPIHNSDMPWARLVQKD